MHNADQDDATPNDKSLNNLADADLAEDVQEAVDTLEDDAPVAVIERLLKSPTGRAAFEQMVVTAISVHEERHSGPLPSPRQIRDYEATLLGGAERIFQMAEREQQHRHAMQSKDSGFRSQAFDHIQRRERRGQTIGGALAFCVLLLSAYMTSLGHPGPAATLAGTTLIGIAAVFVTRQKKSPPPKDPEPASDQDS